jgi:hypothetical protein
LPGCFWGALTFIPSFHALANFANPDLADFVDRNPIEISADNCTFSLFVAPASSCDKARKFFSRNGLSYTSIPAAAGGGVATRIGATTLIGFNESAYKKALERSGFKGTAANVPCENPHHLAVAAIPSWCWHSRRLPTLRCL